MDDRRAPHQPDGREPADIRLGHHALALLEAARETGDPALIIQAEAMAATAGLILAERLRAGTEEP